MNTSTISSMNSENIAIMQCRKEDGVLHKPKDILLYVNVPWGKVKVVLC
jgi:hypothetical protein